MPRRNRRDGAVEPARPVGSHEHHETWRGTEYAVRALSGRADAGKLYRCPGCDQSIAGGQPHLVVWAAGDLDAADRRHWHAPCWSARDTRTPTVQRSRSAPRY